MSLVASAVMHHERHGPKDFFLRCPRWKTMKSSRLRSCRLFRTAAEYGMSRCGLGHIAKGWVHFREINTVAHGVSRRKVCRHLLRHLACSGPLGTTLKRDEEANAAE